MDELPMLRALQLAESNRAIGRYTAHAARKTIEACGVNEPAARARGRA